MNKLSARSTTGLNRVLRLAVYGIPLAAAVLILPTILLADETLYRSYTLKHKTAEEVEAIVLKMTVDFPETEIVVDSKTNKILLSGTEEVHSIVGQLITTLDRPARKKKATPPTLKTYRVEPNRLDEVTSAVRRAYEKRGDVRIAADAETSQLLIFAPEAVHAEIGKRLPLIDVPADQKQFQQTLDEEPGLKPDKQLPGQDGVPTQNGVSGQWQSGEQNETDELAEPRKLQPLARPQRRMTPVERFVSISSNEIATVENRLQATLGGRIKADPRKDVDYTIAVAGQEVQLAIDKARQGVAVSGPETVALQVAQLVQILDSRPEQPDQRIRIVPVRRSDPAKVQQAIQAYRLGYRSLPKKNDDKKKTDESQGLNSLEAGDSDKISQKKSMQVIELVNFQRGVDVPPSNSGSGRESFDRQRRFDDRGFDDDGFDDGLYDEERIRELGPGIEIQSLPDLDVMIIRGRDREVDEVTRIIQEIERLSAETTPMVEVYPLQHVAGDAVAELIETINDDFVGGRQGRVVVLPLGKPNSLLLIGWGEAITAIKELIERLDQPVAPETQLKVFRLQHATSALALSTVNQFFANRTSLGAAVTAEADQRTNSLIVQAAPRDMQEIELLLKKLDVDRSDAVNQAKIIRLKNSLATELAATLQAAIDTNSGTGNNQRSTALELMTIDAQGKKIIKSGILTDVKITPDPQRNALIISAPVESMDLIETLIRQMDEQPAAVAQIKVFRILNGDAGSLVQMLRSLLPSQTGADVSPQLPGAADEQSLAPLRFSVDERTNSIVATGSAGDLRIIEALLLKLDEESIKQRKTIVYRLKNSPALFVSRAVNDFLRSERQVQDTGTTAESPFLQIEREVVVVAEQISNSLIISATPRYFEEVRQVVEKLDSQPPQVMIQVLIGEVALNDADEFGVELGLQDSLLFDRSLLGDLVTTTSTTQSSTPAGILTSTQQVIQAASNTPGFGFNSSPLGPLPNSGSTQSLQTSNSLAGQALSNFATGRINNELGFGGLVLSASSESVSILIRALREARRMEVLSRPQVMTLDNQPAFIQVGQRVPRIVASNITDTGGQVNTVELENTGILLGVTPRISPDGTIVMDIDAEKSEVGPDSEGIPVSVSPEGTIIRSPRIDVTQAQTTVSAASGQTIILGGLITKATSEIHRSVPWLSDIPVLGNLFRFDSVIARRTELLIIMTPHIVYGPDDVERVKQEEAARMHWSLADVHDVHGETGICTAPHCAICNRQIPVIYPDMNPRGVLPVETDDPAHFPNPQIRGGELPLDAYPQMPIPGLPPQLEPGQLPSEQPLPGESVPGEGFPQQPMSKNGGSVQKISSQESRPSALKRITGRLTGPLFGRKKQVAEQNAGQPPGRVPLQGQQPPRRLVVDSQADSASQPKPIQHNQETPPRRFEPPQPVQQASLVDDSKATVDESRTNSSQRAVDSSDNEKAYLEILDYDFSDDDLSGTAGTSK